MNNDSSGETPARKRRPRYRGTHPQRFEQRYKELDPSRFPQMQAHVRAQGRTPAGTHVPILLPELLDAVAPAAGDIVADCTLGYGGHARAVLERIGPTGRMIAFDVDGQELERTRARLAQDGFAIQAIRGNFAGLPRVLADLELAGCNVIYADLGVSSMQIDDPARGFSYRHDGPLDMRMDDRIRRTAADLLNSLPHADIAAALRDLGDEPAAESIASDALRRRGLRPFSRTSDFVEVIRSAVGGDAHDALPRCFAALRILVNDELSALRSLLRIAPDCLLPDGRIALISFHSGEDRMIKQTLRDGLHAGVFDRISDEPITAGAGERRDNPRSSAAKLRWARRAAPA